MEETLAELRKKCVIGFVGGSDLTKQVEQLGPNGTCPLDLCVCVVRSPNERRAFVAQTVNLLLTFNNVLLHFANIVI